MLAPTACKQARVEAQSAPGEKLTILDFPSAMLFKMAARWEMDLSPGGVTSPLKIEQELISFIIVLKP